MSEQGWKEFLAAEGVDDWAVLHGGATAVFRTRSSRQGAEVALALAGIPGFEGSGAVITLADGSLTVRLTRDMWQLEAGHVELARAVSGVARTHGVDADLSATQEVQVAVAETGRDRPWLLARGPGLRADGRRQRRRPARAQLHRLDAGSRRGQVAPARDAHRRLGRPPAREGPTRGGGRGWRPHRRGRRCTGELDPERSSGQPSLHRGLAGRVARPADARGVTGGDATPER